MGARREARTTRSSSAESAVWARSDRGRRVASATDRVIARLRCVSYVAARRLCSIGGFCRHAVGKNCTAARLMPVWKSPPRLHHGMAGERVPRFRCSAGAPARPPRTGRTEPARRKERERRAAGRTWRGGTRPVASALARGGARDALSGPGQVPELDAPPSGVMVTQYEAARYLEVSLGKVGWLVFCGHLSGSRYGVTAGSLRKEKQWCSSASRGQKIRRIFRDTFGALLDGL